MLWSSMQQLMEGELEPEDSAYKYSTAHTSVCECVYAFSPLYSRNWSKSNDLLKTIHILVLPVLAR